MFFIDSNVAVYALATDDALKHEQAAALFARHLADQRLVLSTQVLQETFSVLTRKKRLPQADALDFVALLSQARVVPSSAAFVLEALRFGIAHQLSVWDALIVQAALEAGCKVLFSEDLQAGRRFGELEVVNPFSLSVHEPGPSYQVGRGAGRARRSAR
jgi:predicted nucleic acid-binding protein